MSAVRGDEAASPAALRPMRDGDLDAVVAIEARAYAFPWTRGIFRDCLQAGHAMWVLESRGELLGYGVLGIAAGEAHVLNLCVAPEAEGHGHGRHLLRALLRVARGGGAMRNKVLYISR